MKKRRFLIPILAILCLICIFVLVSCGEEEPAHTHTWGDWVVTTQATCTTKGIQMRVCDCGQNNAQYIPELGHIAAVKNNAFQHWYTCTRTDCGEEWNLAAHTYGEWVETLAPICPEEGSHYKICSACFYKVTEAIPVDPTAHMLATTWTSDDTGHWKTCTRDGCEAIIEKEPHSYDENNICACAYTYRDFGLVFTLSNGTYMVSGYSGTATEVSIPYKYKGIAVTDIGFAAFASCDSLSTITIPASVTSIGSNAFCYCLNLTTVEFGANSQLTSIGSNAFYGCYSLSTIMIPASVTSIGSVVFYYCSNLTTVEFGANSQLTSIGDGAFGYCDIFAITIPVSVTSIEGNPFSGCNNLTILTVASGNTAYYMAGNCLIEKESGTLVSGFANSVIPADGSVKSIGYCAFHSCDSLSTITIPASVTSIGDWAFCECVSLSTITIPASVTSIGSSAFSNCDSLITITIPASVTSIGSVAFYNCDSLTTITIPASVTSIGSSAFSSCDSLTSVTFGTTEGWWYASSSDATSGTAISATDLSDPTTAADRLKITYSRYYWFRG